MTDFLVAHCFHCTCKRQCSTPGSRIPAKTRDWCAKTLNKILWWPILSATDHYLVVTVASRVQSVHAQQNKPRNTTPLQN